MRSSKRSCVVCLRVDGRGQFVGVIEDAPPHRGSLRALVENDSAGAVGRGLCRYLRRNKRVEVESLHVSIGSGVSRTKVMALVREYAHLTEEVIGR